MLWLQVGHPTCVTAFDDDPEIVGGQWTNCHGSEVGQKSQNLAPWMPTLHVQLWGFAVTSVLAAKVIVACLCFKILHSKMTRKAVSCNASCHTCRNHRYQLPCWLDAQWKWRGIVCVSCRCSGSALTAGREAVELCFPVTPARMMHARRSLFSEAALEFWNALA